jgi:carboxyl-terminal processing protease
MKHILVVLISFLFVGCGLGGFTIHTGDLASAYKSQAALNPEKICTPYMLGKVWSYIHKGSYYDITHDTLHNGAQKVLSKMSGDDLSKKTYYPQKVFDIWAKIDYVSRKTNSSRSKVCYAAINGMIAELKKVDRWAHFVDAKNGMKRFGGMVGADYYGLGFLMVIDYKSKRLFIDHVHKGSPAERGGMRRFDEVLAIDGKLLKKLDLKKVVYKFRGKKNTKINLLIKRKGWPAHTFSFTRKRIPHNDARCSMMGEIAYCKIFGFTSKTVKYFEEALETLPNYDKIVIDFRNNRGGLLFSATHMLNRMWVKGKTLTILVKKQYGFVPFGDNTHKKQLLKNKKVVVLINKASASATELVVAALKDYNSVTIVGEKTFGKGVSQTSHFVLGAILSYTSMYFLSPHGSIINRNGVAPDIKVKMTQENFIENNDTQLNAALKLLKKRK